MYSFETYSIDISSFSGAAHKLSFEIEGTHGVVNIDDITFKEKSTISATVALSGSNERVLIPTLVLVSSRISFPDVTVVLRV